MRRAPILALAVALAVENPARADEARVVGLLTDAAGAPVARADVVVTRPDGSGRVVAISDETGRFALAPPEAGPLRLLVVTARGARHTLDQVTLAPGEQLSLVVRDDGAGVVIAGKTRDGGATRGLFGAGVPLALARTRDLGSALVGTPGTAAPAAPAGEPVLAGRVAAEAPVRFAGFDLHDPFDAAVPLALPLAFFRSARLDAGGDLALTPLHAAHTAASVTVAGDLATAARGADGQARPRGVTTGWHAEALAGVHRPGQSLALALAPRREPWQADPESVAAARGRRTSTLPALAWGRLRAGGWELAGGGLLLRQGRDYGRAQPVLPGRDPVRDERSFGFAGLTAHRQLFPGENDARLALGYLRTARTTTLAAFPVEETRAFRASLDARLRFSARAAGVHRVLLAAAVDLEGAERRGVHATRQAGELVRRADARAVLPRITLGETWSPVPSLDLALALGLGKASYTGTSAGVTAPDLDRSFATDFLLAPAASIAFRPLAFSGDPRSLVVFAAGERRGQRLPLAPLAGPAAGPRAPLPAPAEDLLTLGARHALPRLELGLFAHARAAAATIEDRFAPATGRLELFAPAARARYRALLGQAEWIGGSLRVGAAAVLARLEGDHAGFRDEATGELRPAATGAFDGPDVTINRSGPLPFDRPYGLRAYAQGALAAAGFTVDGVLRARVDAGTPRTATARSAASGEGQVFLVPRGALGRTRAVAALDAGLSARRRVAGQTLVIALEAFNLTQHRPAVARNPRYTDALATPTAAGLPEGAHDDFARAVAYAEPLLVRLALGLEL